jgi:hypothetical protein
MIEDYYSTIEREENKSGEKPEENVSISMTSTPSPRCRKKTPIKSVTEILDSMDDDDDDDDDIEVLEKEQEE